MKLHRASAVSLLGRLLTVAVGAVSSAAIAGGLQSGTQAANNFQVWEYGFIAVVAVCYLGYEGVMCFAHKGNWVQDFGAACAKVAVVGGAGTLAVYLFNIWNS